MQHLNQSRDNLPLERLLGEIKLPTARILDRALMGRDVSEEEAVTLLKADGPELGALVAVADELRRQRVGDTVTYVVVRNINFTNVCIKRCGFCAFSRDYREEEGYLLPMEEIVRRAKEAWELGATEVCVQAGLPPHMEGDLYIRICEAIKADVPGIHIHGFSPEEVLYGAIRSRCTVGEYLKALKAAGLGSIPGTAAEILDQKLRDRIAPGRITVEQWTEVITTAHELGLPSTSTMMYGHVENDEHIARHISLIRDIQRATGGFTEFVPLSFISEEAPMYKLGLVEDVRPGATEDDIVKVHAVSRLLLNNTVPNLQVSWVKLGLPFARALLNAGVNDMGGTLINESISTSAGAQHGQLVRPSQFRSLIREAGRIPTERSTLYKPLRVFEDPASDPVDPLDSMDGVWEERLGSYAQLTKMDKYRFRHPKHGMEEARR
jgi:7,8-didemethyl-8-hydroxy-5-deazariboflavin synthase CofH subunit